MLSLRSLAFILASAIRRARALSSAALHSGDKEAISGRKIAKKMATKKTVAFMSISYEQSTLSSLGSALIRSPLSRSLD